MSFLADPVERTVREYSDRSLTDLRPRIITAKNGKRKHLKYCKHDSVTNVGIEGVGINSIILLFSESIIKTSYEVC